MRVLISSHATYPEDLFYIHFARLFDMALRASDIKFRFIFYILTFRYEMTLNFYMYLLSHERQDRDVLILYDNLKGDASPERACVECNAPTQNGSSLVLKCKARTADPERENFVMLIYTCVRET